MHYKNNTIYYNEVEVPKEILSASLVQYGDQSRFYAYLNGWITNYKAGINRNIADMYPFFLDGTYFIKENIDFDRLIEAYWPNISTGVRKKLSVLIKKGGMIKYSLFFVSVFDLDPNTSIKMLDYINSLNCSMISYNQLRFLHKFKDSRLIKLMNIKNYNNFVKLIKDDHSWYEHIMSIYESTNSIWEFNPNAGIKVFYPMNIMASHYNKHKSMIGKYKSVFHKYIQMYEFFDGLEFEGLTVRIPKDSIDLADWGYALDICVGDQKYVDICYRCDGTRFLCLLEKNSKPYIMVDIKPEYPTQIHLADNKNLKEVDPVLHDNIFKFCQAILKQDISYLRPYITNLHVFKKAEMYKEKGWIQPNSSPIGAMINSCSREAKIVQLGLNLPTHTTEGIAL